MNENLAWWAAVTFVVAFLLRIILSGTMKRIVKWTLGWVAAIVVWVLEYYIWWRWWRAFKKAAIHRAVMECMAATEFKEAMERRIQENSNGRSSGSTDGLDVGRHHQEKN